MSGMLQEMMAGAMAAVVDPIPAAMAQSTDGERIKVAWWTTSSGLRTPSGLRDSQLGFKCVVGESVTGVLRCLPPIGNPLRYSDDACTQPIMSTNGFDDSTQYISLADPSALGITTSRTVRYQVYALTGTYEGALYQRQNSQCQQAGVVISFTLEVADESLFVPIIDE